MKPPVMKLPFVADRLSRKLQEKYTARKEARAEAFRRGYIIDDGIISETGFFVVFWGFAGLAAIYVLTASGAITFNNSLTNESITGVYKTVLNRAPSDDEKRRWITENNIGVETMAEELKGSDEYKKLNTPDEEKKQDSKEIEALIQKENQKKDKS